MNKYKVCVYAISKNESKFVERWVNSMMEADEIYVLDTGSTDDTVSKLQAAGVNVAVEEIVPWRFDVARNKSLDMVPNDTDICVCTDLDEFFEPGWRKSLEAVWSESTTRVKYNYIWNFDEYGNPATTFHISKIHKRDGYKWTHPVHEVLTSTTKEVEALASDILLKHKADDKKSRSNYLPLLELSVKEDPEDDRNMHYLGREYMFHGMYNEAIDTLIKHLSLKSATWDAERCASMRFIARCYKAMGRIKEAIMWYNLAIKEASYLRESYVELAELLHYENKDEEAYELLKRAFLIKDKAPIYINEAFAWNYHIYDVMSLVCFDLRLYPESLENVLKAVELNPKDERLLSNLEIIKTTLQKNV